MDSSCHYIFQSSGMSSLLRLFFIKYFSSHLIIIIIIKKNEMEAFKKVGRDWRCSYMLISFIAIITIY